MAFFLHRFRHHETTPKEEGSAQFTKGSVMRHVVTSSVTSAIGLMAIFLVDLADIFFIGQLGEPELAAAVGFAGSLIFFTTSIALAGSITVSSVLSRILGGGDEEGAKQFYLRSSMYGLLMSIPLALVLWFVGPALLSLLGATGTTLEFATQYFLIVVPSFPILMLAMTTSSVLRAHGDFGTAMWVTIIGGGVNAILDPLFIFVFNWGLEGAALASVCARVAILMTAFYLVYRRYGYRFCLFFNVDYRALWLYKGAYFAVFIPAVLSNLSTPLGSGFVISQLAQFGDGYVAGMSVVGRVTPVLFAVVLALSGAVGPIIGQNYGAGMIDRVRCTVYDALKFSTLYVIGGSLALWLITPLLITAFGLSEAGAEIVRFYTTFISISFVFVSAIFIANASFNTLGHPVYATVINVLRNIVFLIPFVYLGALWGGPEGLLIGQALGTALVALIAMGLVWRVLTKLGVQSKT